jgi:cell division protein FtsW (lipid II flippase)
MSSEEKRAWIMLVVTIAAYVSYLAIILARAGGAPPADVPYVATMLWAIGGAIVVAIVLNILVGIFSPRSAGKKDARDREINRFGEYTGQAFLVIGGVAALILAMAEIPHFWIANAVYLAFVLSAVLGSVAKVVAYRRGLPTW